VSIAAIMKNAHQYRKGDIIMKLLNYDVRTLVKQNLSPTVKEKPSIGYSKAQYRILCRIIIQKRITETFFTFLLYQLYDLSDWKKLNYEQMYELIHILSHWDYSKESKNFNADKF